MKQELQDKLFAKYPKIFRQKDLPMQETCMCWGIQTGDGWYHIIDLLCNQIQHYVDRNKQEQVEAEQVKEKYGGLRFYVNGGDTFVEGLIAMAEAISKSTCGKCGAIGEAHYSGRIHTICTPCHKNLPEANLQGDCLLDVKLLESEE